MQVNVFNVLILYPQVPFVHGGTERLAKALCTELEKAGMRADVVTVPFSWEPKENVLREALAWRLLDLDADLVIPLKFPAYFVKHPRKVAWLQHQFRQLYEFHGSELSAFANTPVDHELREKLVEFDTRCLKECLAIYPNSLNTRARLKKYNGIDAQELYPPPMNSGMLRCEKYGDFVLAVGRLEKSKRFDLLLNALVSTPKAVRVKIVGSGGELENLKNLTESLGIAERVEFLGSVPDEALTRLYAQCCAVHFAPLDEDYGLVAVEGMLSSKPVVTCTDSGGPTEHISNGKNGFVIPPEADRHAEVLTRLWEDRDLCKSLGQQAAKDVSHITWDAVIQRLMKWIDR